MKKKRVDFKDGPMQGSPKQARRVTFQPKLSISTKPVQRPLSYHDSSSLREDLLLQNFQLLSFYLQNILYSIFPLTEHAARFEAARKGIYTHMEEPLQALRADPTLRNLT